MSSTGAALDLVKRVRPQRTALVSLLIGDSTSIGYGSAGAGVHTWPSGAPSILEGAYLWNKWTQSSGANRDSDSDTGDDIEAITRVMGEAATDTGPEYSLGWGIQRRLGIDGLPVHMRPPLTIVKYGVVESRATFEGTAGTSWSPQVSSGLWDRYVTYYLDPAIAHLAALDTIDTVELEGIYISLGVEDAAGADGIPESAASNVLAIVERLFDHMSVDSSVARVGLVIPPVVGRTAYAEIDAVRDGIARLGADTQTISVVDADLMERGGIGGGATPLSDELSGQGIVDLGTALAASLPTAGHELWDVTP